MVETDRHLVNFIKGFVPEDTLVAALATDLKLGMGRSRVTIGTGICISVPPSGVPE